MSEPDPSAARLTVDLDALAANYATLKAQSSAEVAPVVKADAYGLGVEPVARRLWAEGARRFFVAPDRRGRAIAGRAEKTRCRRSTCSTDAPPGWRGRLLASGLTPVLNSIAQIDAWRAGGGGAAGLMLDTGLNRLGLTGEEAQTLAADPARLKGIEIAVVMSHLACADQPAHPMNRIQRDRFAALAALFPGARRSLAASDGLFLGPAFAFDMVRTGICLYGGGPEGRPDPRIRPVATFEAPILQVRALNPGDTVGYGAAFTAQRPMRVAVVAAGYADGVLRAAFPRAYGSLAGHRLPRRWPHLHGPDPVRRDRPSQTRPMTSALSRSPAR